MPDEYLIHCPNPGCGIIFKPDPVIYRQGDTRCPKCGADLNQPPPSIRGPYDREDQR